MSSDPVKSSHHSDSDLDLALSSAPSTDQVDGVRATKIPNPVPLAFRVSEVPWREPTYVGEYGPDAKLKAIPLREIFADDLERTLWLAIKFWHITSQYFCHQVREAAASIRKQRPTDPRDLHFRIDGMTGRHWDDPGPFKARESDPFCEELYTYVINVLDGGQNTLKYTEPSPGSANATSRPTETTGKSANT